MTNKEILIKQIIYRSNHRGSKEMDLLLGSFVKKYINNFNEKELEDLNSLLFLGDEFLYNLYFKKKVHTDIKKTKVSKMFINFKL